MKTTSKKFKMQLLLLNQLKITNKYRNIKLVSRLGIPKIIALRHLNMLNVTDFTIQLIITSLKMYNRNAKQVNNSKKMRDNKNKSKIVAKNAQIEPS